MALVCCALLAGLLLGPLVFGRAAPQMHQRLFLGGVAQQRDLQEHDAATRDRLARLQASGVTDAAVREAMAADAAGRRQLKEQLDLALAHRRSVQQQFVTGLLLGLVGLLVIEALVRSSDRGGNVTSRLAWARAAVLSLWLVLWLAAGPTLGPTTIVAAAAVFLLMLVIVFRPRRQRLAQPTD